MIAALYARYSSDNQREESIIAQMRAGRDYCKRKGYTIIKEYADEACTGTNDHRPQYQQMLADAKKGMFEVLVCHKVDRSARNEYDYYNNKRRLSECGVKVEYSAQYVDDTAEGQLSESILVGVASYYSRNLSREIKKGQRENVYAGKIPCGRPCFGYAVDKDKKYIIDEHEAVAVRYIFGAYANNRSYGEIEAWLREHGYRTRRGRPFGKNSLHDLLINPRYIGVSIYGRNVKGVNGKRNNHRRDTPEGMLRLEGVCPSIVSADLFGRVQKRMEANRRHPGAHRAKRDNLLVGKIFCGVCGSAMTGTHNTTAKAGTYYYYRCSRKDRVIGHKCANRLVRADQLEQLIIDQIYRVIKHPTVIRRIASAAIDKMRDQQQAKRSQRKALESRQARLRTALDKLYHYIEMGEPDEFDLARISKVKADLRDARGALANLNADERPLPSFESVCNYIRDRYYPQTLKKDRHALRSLIETFVERVTVQADRICIRLHFAFGWCDW